MMILYVCIHYQHDETASCFTSLKLKLHLLIPGGSQKSLLHMVLTGYMGVTSHFQSSVFAANKNAD